MRNKTEPQVTVPLSSLNLDLTPWRLDGETFQQYRTRLRTNFWTLNWEINLKEISVLIRYLVQVIVILLNYLSDDKSRKDIKRI